MFRLFLSLGFLLLALYGPGARAIPVLGPNGTQDNTQDARFFRELMVLKCNTRGVVGVAFSPDGKRFLAFASYELGDAGPPMPIWPIRDALTGKALVELQQLSPRNWRAYSPDGKYILGCSDKNSRHSVLPDTRIALWDSATGRIVRDFTAQLTEPNEHVKCAVFSPDGKLFATLATTKTCPLQYVQAVGIWDVESGKVARNVLLPFVPRGLAFGPEGKVIVGGGDLSPTAWIKVFDAATGRENLSLKVHGTGVYSVSCSADGKKIVSGNYDGTVRVWNVSTGQELAILRGHDKVVFSVAFSPDGTKIASGGDDGTVRIWGVPGGAVPKPVGELVITKVIQKQDGALGANDTVDALRPGCRCKSIPVKLASGTTYVVTVKSAPGTVIESYVRFQDSQGKILVESEKVKDGNSVRLTYTAPMDLSCSMVVSTVVPNQIGQFQLEVAEANFVQKVPNAAK